jgi:hypothetical protein
MNSHLSFLALLAVLFTLVFAPAAAAGGWTWMMTGQVEKVTCWNTTDVDGNTVVAGCNVFVAPTGGLPTVALSCPAGKIATACGGLELGDPAMFFGHDGAKLKIADCVGYWLDGAIYP